MTGARRPRLGFLGVGWIGRSRLEALVRNDAAEIVAVSDPLLEHARAASHLAGCPILESEEELLSAGLDGIVIATPSALHAEQAIEALSRGIAVFCQKPLARTAEETMRVVAAARAADRLLGVDLSYRFVEGARLMRELVRSGELGQVYAADLVFHNAYGPDKSWFYEPARSGGGCMIDLGTHLVDLALWVLDTPTVTEVSSRLFAQGKPLDDRSDTAEDFGVAQLDLDSQAVVRITCSWNLSAGCDAVIEARFFGTRGGCELRNVGGSFYDFTAERFHKTTREVLCGPPDDWGGRAALHWVHRLSTGGGYDPDAEGLIGVAGVIDRIYGRSSFVRSLPADNQLPRRAAPLAAIAGAR
jgi:predicted dehydrogenase